MDWSTVINDIGQPMLVREHDNIIESKVISDADYRKFLYQLSCWGAPGELDELASKIWEKE